ncbi:MAG TPA: hypothetical protein VHZ76_10715 [Gammaproteobacteria bacterium]|nr:hypothetical protein [Gammaproteobacteria bacterium]
MLGSAVTCEAIPTVLHKKSSEVKRLCSNLELLDSHSALFLMKSCNGAPKLLYTLRTCPTFLNPNIFLELDTTIRASFERIKNTCISDTGWKQANLPVRLGGYGIRSIVSLSLPAFISSVYASEDLSSLILDRKLSILDDPFFALALKKWCVATCSPFPNSGLNFQSSWDRPLLAIQSSQIEQSLSNPSDKARFLGSIGSESGA